MLPFSAVKHLDDLETGSLDVGMGWVA